MTRYAWLERLALLDLLSRQLFVLYGPFAQRSDWPANRYCAIVASALSSPPL